MWEQGTSANPFRRILEFCDLISDVGLALQSACEQCLACHRGKDNVGKRMRRHGDRAKELH